LIYDEGFPSGQEDRERLSAVLVSLVGIRAFCCRARVLSIAIGRFFTYIEFLSLNNNGASDAA